jgi:hypothetical protein
LPANHLQEYGEQVIIRRPARGAPNEGF